MLVLYWPGSPLLRWKYYITGVRSSVTRGEDTFDGDITRRAPLYGVQITPTYPYWVIRAPVDAVLQNTILILGVREKSVYHDLPFIGLLAMRCCQTPALFKAVHHVV